MRRPDAQRAAPRRARPAPHPVRTPARGPPWGAAICGWRRVASWGCRAPCARGPAAATTRSVPRCGWRSLCSGSAASCRTLASAPRHKYTPR
eukprot:scaffold7976_cov403-Prasinococcus_capsulatus_cf.AAC.4